MITTRKLTVLLTSMIMLSQIFALAAHGATADIVLYASKAPVRSGTWTVVADSTAAGGFLIASPNLGASKLSSPLANPTDYFELTFPAYSGQPYHLWIRARAADDSYSNDSVYVQFSDSVTSAGSAIDRVGTTSGAAVVLQACNGALEHGWGWTDNGWCGSGTNLYFQTTGTHTIRLQKREDGISIDQIVLSPETYLTSAPGKAVDDSTLLAANLPTLTTAPQVSISASPASGSAPLNVTFSANVVLPNGSVSGYKWNFGDGQTSTAAMPSHTYQGAGNYTASLQVTDTAGTSGSNSSLISVAATTNGVKLRVVEANIFYGGHGTDNVINLDRLTSTLVKMNPDVASLIEVIGGYNDPSLITNLMAQKTGLKWYDYYVPKYPGCVEGVMILSKWPILSTAQHFMSYQMPVAEATISVNGKPISFFSTHFQWPSSDSSQRQVEANELVAFAGNFAEPRIIAGDFNAQDGTPEINIVEEKYFSAWDTAVNSGAAVAYADNPASFYTRSRRSRIDHVFYSKGTTSLDVTGAQVPDTRNLAQTPVVLLGTPDDKGVRPSDHNFVALNFLVY